MPPKIRFTILGLIGIFIAIGWFLTAPSLKPLPVLGNIPEFSMTDSKNNEFGSADLQDKIWVADFIFTTCAGPCPVMSMEMAAVYSDFKDNDVVRTVSFTVNPDYDTPDVLAEYAKRYQADTGQWHFLTAPYEQIQSIISNGFKMGDMEEIVFHSTRFALVDKNQNIRGYYIGTEPNEVDKLKKDIKKLLKEQ